MQKILQAFLVALGVIAITISLAHLAVGPEAIIGGSDVNPTSDGEDRFFAGCSCASGSSCCGAPATCSAGGCT